MLLLLLSSSSSSWLQAFSKKCSVYRKKKAVFVVRYANNVQSVINLLKNIDTKNEVSFHSLLPLSSAEGLNKVRRFRCSIHFTFQLRIVQLNVCLNACCPQTSIREAHTAAAAAAAADVPPLGA